LLRLETLLNFESRILMVSFPPSKINLGLHIVSKRPDSFHDLETCFYPVPWTDILEIIPSSKLALTISGNAIPGREEDNLCLKAYHLIKADFNIAPVKIHLHKIIPIGAGLGGGSSDAAYALRLLNEIFNLSLSIDQLKGYASRLGSDCSFFVQGKPMLGTGKGEVLNEIDVNLKGLYLVIVKPAIHVSTQEAYSGISPKRPTTKIQEILKRPVVEWKEILKNDFEESIFKKYPAIAEIKTKLYSRGAVYASMSGSGSSVFGLFEKPVQLEEEFVGMDYWGMLPY
jgi:4-diphosphocytidyl-2-C-methyl-D-erythritol kinase